MIEIPDFEALYRDEPDPWSVATSFYERRKLELTLAALTRPRYHRAWDPASGTGHLAARLASRCDSVTASDAAAAAVRLSAARCGAFDNVMCSRRRFPDDGSPAAKPYDLVILSEFLYYLDTDERSGVAPLLETATAPDAEVVAVHWRPRLTDAWSSGAQVQQELADRLPAQGWRLVYRIEDLEFDLAGWRRGADQPLD